MNVVVIGRSKASIIYRFFLVVCVVRCVDSTESPSVRVAQPVSYTFSEDDNIPTTTVRYVARVPRHQKSTSTDKETLDETVQKDEVKPAEELPMEARTLDEDDEELILEDDELEGPEEKPAIDHKAQRSDRKSSKVKPKSTSPDQPGTEGQEFESLRKVPKFMTEEWSKDDVEEDSPTEDYDNKDQNENQESKNKERLKDRSDRTLKRPKKNHLSDKKYLSKPQSFSYADKPQGDQRISASGHHHKKKKKKSHSEKHVQGGGKDHHSHHHSSTGKKGDKGYKGYHKYEKGKKGHHDKESHKGAYKDQKGKKKKHKEEGSHYGEHKKLEKGKKGAKFGESGEHKKGHSTKGEHNIHKKDEYLKKHEFYDEHHEGGDHEKHGGFHAEHGKKHGGKKKAGHHKSGYHEDHHGKKGHHMKGNHHKDHKGHKEAGGHEKHHSHKEEYDEKGGHKEGKKWGYSKKDKRHISGE